MVGGVSQGSEKKKVSVGLFSTFRHPLEFGTGSHTSTPNAFDNEKLWQLYGLTTHKKMTCEAESARFRQKPSETPANCHIWLCRVGTAALRNKHVTFRAT